MITLKTYFIVFTALLVLTALTTGAAFVNLGAFNVAVAMSIAVVKALLVALYFMHLRHSARLILVFVIASLAWLGHLIVGSLWDYLTRSW
ncbi:MAG TPA: cytochrome C oxidase subunit IV family protein [Candidatus Binatia bacterium]|nr:cytochrome C oxidase subunit IV family protein [Candidatus Binatia bacterium]